MPQTILATPYTTRQTWEKSAPSILASSPSPLLAMPIWHMERTHLKRGLSESKCIYISAGTLQLINRRSDVFYRPLALQGLLGTQYSVLGFAGKVHLNHFDNGESIKLELYMYPGALQ